MNKELNKELTKRTLINDETGNAQSRPAYSQKLWLTGQKHAGEAWYQRHWDALQQPRVGFEAAVVAMLQGWLLYADNHAAQHDSLVGSDGVLGDHWAAIGHGLRGLLNGETGRLDCGCVDSIVAGTLREEGYEEP